jgi:hypothetical protein
LGDVDRGDSQENGEGSDDLKVHQAFPTDAADAFQVAVAGDAGDQRAENQGRDNYLDQSQKDIAEESELFGELGTVQANFEAGEHGKENPEGERALANCGDCKAEKTQPAEH